MAVTQICYNETSIIETSWFFCKHMSREVAHSLFVQVFTFTKLESAKRSLKFMTHSSHKNYKNMDN